MSKFEQFKKDFTDWMIDQLEVNKEDGYPHVLMQELPECKTNYSS